MTWVLINFLTVLLTGIVGFAPLVPLQAAYTCQVLFYVSLVFFTITLIVYLTSPYSTRNK